MIDSIIVSIEGVSSTFFSQDSMNKKIDAALINAHNTFRENYNIPADEVPAPVDQAAVDTTPAPVPATSADTTVPVTSDQTQATA